jgi:hypothetical protein
VRRLLFVLLGATHFALAADVPPVDATTASGDKVRLFPNGRWEYVDAKKAEAQKPVVQAYDKKHDDETAAEQGGLFGIGRKIKPGDPDYNRGSLGGKH